MIAPGRGSYDPTPLAWGADTPTLARPRTRGCGGKGQALAGNFPYVPNGPIIST